MMHLTRGQWQPSRSLLLDLFLHHLPKRRHSVTGIRNTSDIVVVCFDKVCPVLALVLRSVPDLRLELEDCSSFNGFATTRQDFVLLVELCIEVRLRLYPLLVECFQVLLRIEKKMTAAWTQRLQTITAHTTQC